MTAKTPAKIMIVDDEVHVVEFVSELIADEGHTVVGKFSSGHEILHNIAQTKPDIILLDVTMPGKTGDDLVAEIKSHYPEQTIIMLTSKNTESTVIKCIQNGAVGYILKSQGAHYISQKVKEIWDEKHP